MAILSYLSRRFTGAKLLPVTNDPFGSAQVLSDLSFCASVLHPLVTRIRIPSKFCDLPDTDQNVWQLAATEMQFHFERIENRLREAEPWWYGEKWSSMDTYIFWVWFRVIGAGLPTGPYPAFRDQSLRMEARPSTHKALAREAKAQAELEARGLALKFQEVVP